MFQKEQRDVQEQRDVKKQANQPTNKNTIVSTKYRANETLTTLTPRKHPSHQVMVLESRETISLFFFISNPLTLGCVYRASF